MDYLVGESGGEAFQGWDCQKCGSHFLGEGARVSIDYLGAEKMASRKATRTKLKAPEIILSGDDSQSSLVVRAKSLVFISHDSRDADLAEAFANLLSDVSAGTLKSFRSSDKKTNSGIEFGAEWYTSIMSQLGDATDVVALLTARSVDRPWILYEAGVAKGKLETTVLGLALGVPLEKVSTGPFGQFQNCGDDEDSLTKLVMQLLQRNPDASPREEAVRMQVKLFIQAVAKIPSNKAKKVADGDSPSDEQNVAKLFEEVKAMVRELPDRVDDRVRVASKRGYARKRKLHPGMIEDMLMTGLHSGGLEGGAAGLLLVLSLLRDDVPWMFEPGMELYRALSAADSRGIEVARKNFQIVMDVAMHGSWVREIMRAEDEEMFFVIRHLPNMIDRLVHELPRKVFSRKLPAAKSANEAT